MNDGPRSFNNHVLIFDRAKEGDDPYNVPFTHLFIWMQVYSLLVGFRSKRVIRSISHFVGAFIEVDTNNFLCNCRSYMRLRVKIDVSKAVKQKLVLTAPSGKNGVEVQFCYEHLPTFFLSCGKIEHGE